MQMKKQGFGGLTILLFMIVALMSGCASTTELGKGGSMATGAAGNNGTQGESKQLVKCDKIIATVEIDEPTSGADAVSWVMLAQQLGVPSDTRPLINLMVAQSGCFRVVDRAAGLRAAKREHELAEAGLTRKNSSIKKGNIVEAQYTLVPKVAISQQNYSGRGLAGLAGFIPIPGASMIGALAGGVSSKTSEAQVVVTIINNETLVQEGVAEGSATAKDYSFGGGLLGVGGNGIGGAGIGAWNKTPQGKVVIAAFMDSWNKLVPMVKDLQVPQQASTTTGKH